MPQSVDSPEEAGYKSTELGISDTGFAPFGVTRVVGFTISAAIMIVLIWTAAAQAQSPAEEQYKERSAPSGPALGSSGVAVGEAKTEGAKAKNDPEAKASGSKMGVLPATGGPMLIVYAGVLVASGTGLVLLHRRSSRHR